MIRKYGKPALVKLIRSYASGVSDDEAFSAALGVGTAGFNAAWLKDLGAATPKAYGPQPAPAGPLPAGWGDAPVQGQGTAQSGDPSAAVFGIALVVLLLGGGLLVLRSRRPRPVGQP
jgi:hypothetical protein